MRRVIGQSWWMCVFCVGVLCCYANAMQKKGCTQAQLQEQLDTLMGQRDRLIEQQGDLLLQVESQDDPAWIQLTLMKELGVVPEGQIKVFFQPDRG